MKRFTLIAAVLLVGAAMVFVGCSREQDAAVEVPESFEGMTLSIITFTAEWDTQGVAADLKVRLIEQIFIQFF